MRRSTGWQARSRRRARQGAGRARGAALLLLLGCAGCGTPSLDPAIGWWHSLEGGTIAEQRPPPPGIGQPYPRVFSVPARPQIPDAAARTALTDRLASGREAAVRVAARDPLPAPGTAVAAALAGAPGGGTTGAAAPAVPAAPTQASPPAAGSTQAGPATTAAARPATPGASSAAPSGAAPPGAAPPAGPAPATEGASATLAAASAPPAPAHPAAAAPGRSSSGKAAGAGVAKPTPATAAELAALDKAAPAAGSPLLRAGTTPDGEALPVVAAAPPAPPGFSDLAALPVATTPPLPAPVPQAARGTPVRFLPGTATLAQGQAGALHALAGERGGAGVAVTGFGDSGTDAPAGQAAALDLALRRAEAIAAVLGTYGVPPSAIRVGAEAFGRGGAVRLLR